MKINNFRQYVMEKISQTKIDKKDTKEDIVGGKKKGLDKYQKGFYDGRITCFKEIYDDCKKYEWIKRELKKELEKK